MDLTTKTKKYCYTIITWIVIGGISIQIFGCGKAEPIDEIAQTSLYRATKLLIARDKVVAEPSKISNIAEGVAIVSTEKVDAFVSRKIDLWITTADELNSFSKNYSSNQYSDDTNLIACFLWISISQAERNYCKKTIETCEQLLSTKNLSLNPYTVTLLEKVPLIRHYILSELYNEEGIKIFLRRMIITEYLKMNNAPAAEEWITKSNADDKEKMALRRYIQNYNIAMERIKRAPDKQ